MSALFDQFPSESLRSLRNSSRAAAIVGVVDLAVTITYILVNVYVEGGATGWDIYLMIFQVFHVWSWVCAASMPPAAAEAGASSFVRMTFVVYVVAFIVDVVGLVLRFFLGLYGILSFGLLEKVCLGLVVGFVAIDIIVIILVSMAAGVIDAQQRSIRLILEQVGRENNMINAWDQWRKVPDALRFGREQQRMLGLLQFYVFVLFFVFYCLGFTIDTTFTWLYYLQVLEGFLWVFAYATAEGVHSTPYLGSFLFFTGLDGVASIVASAWRFFLVGECGLQTGTNSCGWIYWLAWFIVVLGLVEVAFDIYSVFLTAVILLQTRVDKRRVAALKRIYFPERVTFSPSSFLPASSRPPPSSMRDRWRPSPPPPYATGDT